MIAIDAPAPLSGAPHADDTSLSPTFRPARCAEITLGREHGIWVPWVAPTGPPIPVWMTIGLELRRWLAANTGAGVIEVYPYGAFRRLAKRRLPKKQTAGGLRVRLELLAAAGLDPPGSEAWSHHAIDALAAALVARDHQAGNGCAVGCGHDDTLIWLPAAPTAG